MPQTKKITADNAGDGDIEKVVAVKAAPKKKAKAKANPAARKTKTFTKQMKDDLEKEIKEFELATENLEEEENIPAGDKIEEVQDENLPAPVEAKAEHPRSVHMYKRLAFAFLFLTVVLIGLVGYFSFARLTITIIPKEETLSDVLILDINDRNKFPETPDGALSGLIEKTNMEVTQSFTSTGKDVIGEEVTGKVKILNTTNFAQPLVATTRLLSPDNKLFRIKETVNVPAQGEVEVDIYADEPSEAMAIGSTKFTIPGLRVDKQDKIYAMSEADFIYANKTKPFIQQADIDNAVENTKLELVKKAEEKFAGNYMGFDQAIYSVDNNSIEVKIDGKVGDEVEEFNLTIKADIEVVAFGLEEAAEKVYNRLLAGLKDNQELISFDPEKVAFELTASDLDKGTAVINAYFSGITGLKDGSVLIDKEKLVGLNSDQLRDYLGSFPEIESYQADFSPSFVKKAPKLVDRITIIIKADD